MRLSPILSSFLISFLRLYQPGVWSGLGSNTFFFFSLSFHGSFALGAIPAATDLACLPILKGCAIRPFFSSRRCSSHLKEMRITQSVLIALGLCHGVISAPTSLEQPERRSFKVETARRSNTIHGPAALRKAYVKYGITAADIGLDLDDFEPKIKTAVSDDTNEEVVEPDQTGAVSAASVEGDASFVSPITIGDQKLVVTFDTGSSDVYETPFAFDRLR